MLDCCNLNRTSFLLFRGNQLKVKKNLNVPASYCRSSIVQTYYQRSHGWTWGQQSSLLLFLILLYIWILILVILFYKRTLLPLNNIIDYFKSIVIITNFFTTFLQTIKVANSYWFTFELTIYITFLLTNNQKSLQFQIFPHFKKTIKKKIYRSKI